MRIIAIVLIASCSSPATPPRKVTPTPTRVRHVESAPIDLAAFTAPPIDRHAARVVMQGAGQLERFADGPDIGVQLDECSNLEVAIVDRRDVWVRVIEQQQDIALATWVPESYLGDVITTRTPLVATRGAQPNVWLLPGAPVRVLERDATHARVELRQLNDRAQGWIDASALGQTYTRAAAVPPDRTARLDTTQPILDAPTATSTSTFATAFGGPYERIGDRHGFTELRYRSEWLDAHGFVETSGIKTPGPTGMCESMRTRFFVGPMIEQHADDLHHGPLEVPANTCLRVRPDGPVVGIQRVAGTRDVVVERSGRWAQASIAMTLGTHVVWMRVERADGKLAILPGC